jgi:hypothetical protein
MRLWRSISAAWRSIGVDVPHQPAIASSMPWNGIPRARNQWKPPSAARSRYSTSYGSPVCSARFHVAVACATSSWCSQSLSHQLANASAVIPK